MMTWLQNMHRAEFDAVPTDELPDHIWRKRYARERHNDRVIIVGPPRPSASASADELRARGLIGIYGMRRPAGDS